MLSGTWFTGFEKQACTNLCFPCSKALLCMGLLLFAGALLAARLKEEEKLYEAEQSLFREPPLSGSILDLTQSLFALQEDVCMLLGPCNCARESSSPVEVSEALVVLPHGSSELAATFWVPLL